MIFSNMNQYAEYFHENWLPKGQRKFEHFVDIDKYQVVFQYFLNLMLIILSGGLPWWHSG